MSVLKWYDYKRDRAYHALCRYAGVEASDPDYIEYREALKDTFGGRIIEARYETDRALHPVSMWLYRLRGGDA